MNKTEIENFRPYTKNKNCGCNKNCNCKAQSFGDSVFGDSKADNYTTLEEHFENFGEMAESFLGMGKKAQARKQQRQDVRTLKKMAKVDIKKARAEAIKTKSQAKLEAAQRPSILAASQQADTTNQLASQVTPAAAPISYAQTPMAASQEGAPSYATLPMPSEQPTAKGLQGAFGQNPMSTDEQPTEEEETPTEAAKTTPEAVKEATGTKKNITLYIIIAVVVLGGAYFLMKKK